MITNEEVDSFRALIRRLEKENESLKRLLSENNINFKNTNLFDDTENDNYEQDQGSLIIDTKVTLDMANYFFSLFWGRTDVYAKRSKSGKYYPQCDNRWNKEKCPINRGLKQKCKVCDNRIYSKLTKETILKHLIGSKEDCTDVVGIYPLLEDSTTRLLVFDFDNHNKEEFVKSDNQFKKEVDCLRKILEAYSIPFLVERSRSGNGAHIWIPFKEPIKASLARSFGAMLLEKGMEEFDLCDFTYYDRMFPTQDETGEIGNLIALPLQGRALIDGNSAFVDNNWNAYPNQWEKVYELINNKLSKSGVEKLMLDWKQQLSINQMVNSNINNERPKPWRKNISFNKEDVNGKIHIILSDGIYIDTLNLMPRICNQIRSLAAFDNPIYYKNKNMKLSNYNNLSVVYLGMDKNGYILIPRGLKDKLFTLIKEANIAFEVEDKRALGKPIRVSFNVDLYQKQDIAAELMLNNEIGVLNAATAFGKTAVASYIISERKLSTLIILNSKDLQQQWLGELSKFLTINEELPSYKTKTGIIKKRNSVIGLLNGSKNTLTVIIDIATIGSLVGKENLDETLSKYGVVIMDECHNAGSMTAVSVLQRVVSKYVYGVSATLKRGDKLDKIIHMYLGPVRHKYTAKEKAKDQNFDHFVYPRYTKVSNVYGRIKDINSAYREIANNNQRNNLIIEDVRKAISNNRSPVILTRYKEQAKMFYDKLKTDADEVFLFYGDNTDKENAEIRKKLSSLEKEKSLILIATGNKIGEGFNLPRLDTMMLASPVSGESLHEQYVGRLNRDYEGKKEVIVFDYVDSHISYFDSMFHKRLKNYKRIGYTVLSDANITKQVTNAIFDSNNYQEVFENDLIESSKSILISSPEMTKEKINRLIELVSPNQEKGVVVSVITKENLNSLNNDSNFFDEMIFELKNNGINVITKEEVDECFAIIDDEIVWHGGANLLGQSDVWDNLIRIRSNEIAEELKELSSNDN